MMVSNHAYAGSYTYAVEVEELCKNTGKLGEISYEMKVAGLSLKEFQETNKGLPEDSVKAAEAGYNAPNSDFAYKKSWAMCMDAHAYK